MAVAALLGGVIGFDRERRNKAAGIRTHMLVSLGAASFMLVAYFLIADLGGEEAGRSGVRLDPIAVVQGIVAGVGFIGAGQIFQQRGTVQGLTSAAGIWATAAIGTLVGTGHYIAPVAATILVFLIIAAFGKLDEIVAGTDDRARSATSRARTSRIETASSPWQVPSAAARTQSATSSDVERWLANSAPTGSPSTRSFPVATRA